MINKCLEFGVPEVPRVLKFMVNIFELIFFNFKYSKL